jgi:hypothetical protein
MKSVIIIISLCFLLVNVHGQKKKDIQQYKIKSITVNNEDSEKANGKSIPDSYMKFDDNGNTIEEIEYDSNGKIKTHFVYEYDEEGNKIKETEYKPDGTKDKVITYKYKDGLKVERITYLANGKIKSKKKYVYDYH